MDCVSSIENNESEISQSKSAHTNPKSQRPRIRIIFEFSVSKPTLIFYRAVQATDGGYRMEKRGPLAKKYKAFMWTGGMEGLLCHRRAVESWHGPSTEISINQSQQAV